MNASRLFEGFQKTTLVSAARFGAMEIANSENDIGGSSSNTEFLNRVTLIIDYLSTDRDTVSNRSKRVGAWPSTPITLLTRLISTLAESANTEELKYRTCQQVAKLYQLGLGVPRDERMRLVWQNFSEGYQTKFDVVVPFETALRVLKIHVARAKKFSIDNYRCFPPALIEHYTSMISSMAKFHLGDGGVYLPKLDAMRVSVEYVLNRDTTYRPVDAFVHYKQKGIPLGPIVDQLSLGKITLPRVVTHKLVVTGYLCMDDDSFELLSKYRPEITSRKEGLRRLFIEDQFGHTFNNKKEYDDVIKAEELANKASTHLDKANNALSSKTAPKDLKKKARRVLKAHKEGSRLWRRLILKDHIEFIPFDMYRLTGETLTPVRAKYGVLHNLLKDIFGKALEYSTSKSVNQEGYTQIGVIKRAIK